MRYAMIMAGGAGVRLWPLSRKDRPKQLLPLISDHRATGAPATGELRSLLEIAAARLEGLVPPERRYICTGEQYRDAIKESLPEFTDERILGEPTGRDTVNAIGFAAAVFQKLDKDAVFVVLTADHLIEPEDTFKKRVDLAFRLVEQDPRRLVTFSIKPTYPATGYGYVERGPAIHGIDGAKGLAFRVERFVEKPDERRAQAYFESGHFAWNSGMFVFSAGTFLECLAAFKPDSLEGLKKIQDAWGTKRQTKVLQEIYPTLPKISVDFAVMEPASAPSRDAAKGNHPHPFQVCTVLTDVQWLDVGSWSSFAQTLEPDKMGNRVGGQMVPVLVDSKNNLVVGEAGQGAHTVALLGVENLIVVHTRDATLVMTRDKAEQLKKLHEQVADRLK
jgi:mannose-1-phosphate guanylyltransferase